MSLMSNKVAVEEEESTDHFITPYTYKSGAPGWCEYRDGVRVAKGKGSFGQKAEALGLPVKQHPPVKGKS
jgi:hypothetical protein